MNVALIDVDSHHFPNLALMKISAYHKSQGDSVNWCFPMEKYDIVYQSKVFDETYSKDIDYTPQADAIIKGGAGYDKSSLLPDEIEHIYPDYSLYPELTADTAYGYSTRGCCNACPFCIVSELEGRKVYKTANIKEFWQGQRNIKLMDANLLACPEREDLLGQLIDSGAYVDFTQGLDIRRADESVIELINHLKLKEIHFAWDNPKSDLKPLFERYKALARKKPHGNYATVYVLVNYNSTMEENLYRIYSLRDMGYRPYVMVYDKPSAKPEIRALQRWCNNIKIFKSTRSFDEYMR